MNTEEEMTVKNKLSIHTKYKTYYEANEPRFQDYFAPILSKFKKSTILMFLCDEMPCITCNVTISVS